MSTQTEAVTVASSVFTIPLSSSTVTGVVSGTVDLSQTPPSWRVPDFSKLNKIPLPFAHDHSLGGDLGALNPARVSLPDVADMMATNDAFLALDRARGSYFDGSYVNAIQV